MKPWYEELFTGYAATYDREVFTQGTQSEVDFIEGEIAGDKGCAILDLGCGTGRHSIELARRGYRVTGIDLSADQLAAARAKAGAAGVRVEFLRRDARGFRFKRRFGLAIMLCEGAFPLMETDEMNFRILRNAARALAPRGRLIMTTTNALFPLFHSVKDLVNADAAGARYDELSFDFLSFRERAVIQVTDDAGPTSATTPRPSWPGCCGRPASPRSGSSAACPGNSAAAGRSPPTISR